MKNFIAYKSLESYQRELVDTAARYALDYHCGQGCPLYALVSTGAIVPGVDGALSRAMELADDVDAIAAMGELRDALDGEDDELTEAYNDMCDIAAGCDGDCVGCGACRTQRAQGSTEREKFCAD